MTSANVRQPRKKSVGQPATSARRGHLKHSLAYWCCETSPERWSVERTCQVARELGCASVELVAPQDYPTLQRYGLTSAINQIYLPPDPPFVRGYNQPAHWPRVMAATREAIDAAAAFGVPNVICFTGFAARYPGHPRSPKISPEEGARNCVRGLRQMVRYAAEKKVTLCLEMLNSRVADHPMKGHPGYQGDHTDYCMDIIQRVGSPWLKLLFDVYHVQIMDGDVITRIRQFAGHIGHVHVAGAPGRGELNDQQEINFPAVMRALVAAGYDGYVGQEFIPTGDLFTGLKQAVDVCDV